MEARFAGLVPFVHATAPFFYGRETKLATLVQDFKYRKFPGLARELGRMAALELLPTGFFTGIDVIVPVPLHWRKRMSRGYNQCEQIAYGVGEKTGLPVATNLRAARRHSTQTHLSREERQRNIKGVFKVRKAEALAGKHILLVDDICTTGSTLTAAAQALLAVCPGARLSMMTIGVV